MSKATRRAHPARPPTLSLEVIGRAIPEKPWWRPRREWPETLSFKDGQVETVVDRTPLPPPWYPGVIGCAARACVDAPLAERASRGRAPK
jgi:hypothetical protein